MVSDLVLNVALFFFPSLRLIEVSSSTTTFPPSLARVLPIEMKVRHLPRLCIYGPTGSIYKLLSRALFVTITHHKTR